MLRLLPLVFLSVFIVICILNLSILLPSGRQHRSLTEPLLKVLHEQSESKEHFCRAYFEQLATNLDRDSLLENVSVRKPWIRTFVGHIRAYGACFLAGNTELEDEMVTGLEQKLFPLFSGKYPVVTKWDGTVEPSPEKTTNSFWGNRKAAFSGRGIVLSMSDAGFQESKRLLRVLRFLENDLPIQMVHKGDLSKSLMEQLTQVARSDMDLEYAKSSICPPQEIYFVDASEALLEGVSKYFMRFSNKWIASLFNTFDEMILMDTDVVPFVEPSALFGYETYKQTGAYFFRDRLTKEATWTTPMAFFRSLHPTEDERKAFQLNDYRPIAESTGFFQSKSKHVMESGMVALRRSSHFTGLLISTAMQFWHETSGPFYGDKELFWLGQVYAGQEKFAFNKHGAAGIGELTETEKTWKVCSAQPAHFDDENKLLWINGGLQKCKKGFHQKDYSSLKALREKFTSAEDLHEYYRSPAHITGAVIPTKKRGFVQDRAQGCIGYLWCASVPKEEALLSVVMFSPEQLDRIKQIQHLWYGPEYQTYDL